MQTKKETKWDLINHIQFLRSDIEYLDDKWLADLKSTITRYFELVAGSPQTPVDVRRSADFVALNFEVCTRLHSGNTQRAVDSFTAVRNMLTGTPTKQTVRS